MENEIKRGRPRKYQTEEERINAYKQYQREYQATHRREHLVEYAEYKRLYRARKNVHHE
jgi:hypothetical protein